jgi:lipopolysaccharide-induced tumor necrosis factor-alpha factor
MDTKAPTPQILLPGQHHMDGPNIPHQPTGISAQSHDQTHQPDPTHIVSPQSTGTKNLTSQPTLTTTHQQEPIEMASPQPPEYANMAQQEKAYLPPNGNAQHSNGAPPSAAQGGPAKNIYTYATPLPSLQGVPAPVDCPFCGQRELTRTVHVSGGTTQ